ncbi:MAG: hypothetical protein H6594_12185 [Flavobacteriales bacterium]|nr:hypothetical protein [Flavobacteriales bacterium]
MRYLIIILGLGASLFLAGCRKDPIDLSELHDNPFDPDFDGPAMFSFDTTYIETVVADTIITYQRQVVQFHVHDEHFLSAASYYVQVTDLSNGEQVILGQYPVGSHVFRYRKTDFAVGQELCLQLRLSNDLSYGRPETICCTLVE